MPALPHDPFESFVPPVLGVLGNGALKLLPSIDGEGSLLRACVGLLGLLGLFDLLVLASAIPFGEVR
jgi:hypothetical protein